MADVIKAYEVQELVATAESCPENLQEKCFELLLRHYLERRDFEEHTAKAFKRAFDDARQGVRYISEAVSRLEDIGIGGH